MANIYRTRYFFKLLFVVLTILLATSFLYVSNNLINSLEKEERSKIDIWAEATTELAGSTTEADMSLILKIIQSNTTIPVIITDSDHSILWHTNCEIHSRDSIAELKSIVNRIREDRAPIEVFISEEVKQYLYYDDSLLLKRLQNYPYIQLAIFLIFIIITLLAFSNSTKAEQNQVWVGLSKETAHQLGTPISSLMAWIEYMRSTNQDSMVIEEMDKDVHRLNTIADRFSKIGSQPNLEKVNLNILLIDSTSYMRKRVSSKVFIELALPNDPVNINGSKPLLEWVVENLCKNSVDATNGSGRILIDLKVDNLNAILTITDNGKGIPRKNFKTIFNPGYTTRKRGWGLGLTLAKRIVEQYHRGNIFVKESIPFERTVFCIQIPLLES